ncbi:hypothetical protein QJQ45_020987 [Haematococcus lacustris]|nr:hypothetical protein QJQ45_020987 [Haematococcus lacustris]
MEELTELPKELFAGVYSSRLLRRSHPPVSHPPVSSAGAMLFALLSLHCLPFAAAPIPSPADKSAADSVAGLFTLLRSDLAITKAQQTSTVNKKTLF